jgi:hypothetical protein
VVHISLPLQAWYMYVRVCTCSHRHDTGTYLPAHISMKFIHLRIQNCHSICLHILTPYLLCLHKVSTYVIMNISHCLLYEICFIGCLLHTDIRFMLDHFPDGHAFILHILEYSTPHFNLTCHRVSCDSFFHLLIRCFPAHIVSDIGTR